MIFAPFERMVAMRYLRARRQEGFISVIAAFSLLGIALGVATLIIVLSVMNGFRAELLGKILGLNGHITVYSAAGQLFTDYENLTNRIRMVQGVTSATPLVQGQAMATANGIPSFGPVIGMLPKDLATHRLLSTSIKAGSLQAFEGNSVLIGTRMAQRMGLNIGDTLTLINPKGQATAVGTMPKIQGFTIAAEFEVGMYEYDSSYIYLPFETAQAFLGTGPGANAIEVMVNDPDRARDIGFLISSQVPQGSRIYDWQQANSTFFNAVLVERNVMFLILTLIILVAAFNIVSSMIMLVKDKGRDIAVMRTMGASRGMIMRIFFLSGASVGVIGTFAGFLLGVVFTDHIEQVRQWMQTLTGTPLFSPEIYFLSHLPAKLEWPEVIQVVVLALFLTVLATIYPSWRAARLDPVEALRYE
jgi:lipoprotein-releasing system permease protein